MKIINTQLHPMEGEPRVIGFLTEAQGRWNAVVEDWDMTISRASVRVTSSDAKNQISFILNEIANALGHECAVRPEEAVSIPNLMTLYQCWLTNQQRRLEYFRRSVIGWTFESADTSFTLTHSSKGSLVKIKANEEKITIRILSKVGENAELLVKPNGSSIGFTLMFNWRFLSNSAGLNLLMLLDRHAFEGRLTTHIANNAKNDWERYAILLPAWQNLADQDEDIMRRMAQAAYDDFDRVMDLMDKVH